jgi:hypothetical protein
MKRLAAISLLLALLVAGCRPDEGDVLARVGENVLHRKDVLQLLPEGVTPADSASMVQQYINTWALAHLKVLKAQEVLSADEKDVTDEVRDYRDNLLRYRLEQSYTESALDTTVSEAQMQDYYDSHSQNWKFPYIIAKARIITLSQNSPHYDTIKKTYADTEPEDVAALRELCTSYAERYEEFGGNWMPMPSIAKAVPGLDAESCETIFRGGNKYIKIGDGKDYFIFLTDKIPVGAPAPYEYCRQTIKDAILIQRKQDILLQLEQDLLQEGIESEKLKIYDVEQ